MVKVIMRGLVNVDPFGTGRISTCDVSTLDVKISDAQKSVLRKVGPRCVNLGGTERRSARALARRGILVHDDNSYHVADRYILLAAAVSA